MVTNPMKKYTITKAFSVLEKILLIPEDEIYAEQRLSMMLIYSIKTRKMIGKVSIDIFNSSAKTTRVLKSKK
jgi:hypothetical protein